MCPSFLDWGNVPLCHSLPCPACACLTNIHLAPRPLNPSPHTQHNRWGFEALCINEMEGLEFQIKNPMPLRLPKIMPKFVRISGREVSFLDYRGTCMTFLRTYMCRRRAYPTA